MAATWSGVSQEAMAIRQDTREVPEIDVFGQMRVPVWKKPTSAKLEQPALSRSGLGVVTARNGDVLHTERDIELHLGLALKGATTGRLGLHVSIYHKHLHNAHAQTCTVHKMYHVQAIVHTRDPQTERLICMQGKSLSYMLMGLYTCLRTIRVCDEFAAGARVSRRCGRWSFYVS
jgi:hypothetical protein